MKKILSLVLVVVMAFGFGMTNRIGAQFELIEK